MVLLSAGFDLRFGPCAALHSCNARTEA